MNAPLLDVRDAEIVFTARRGGVTRHIQAVSGASISVARGQTVGLVGESGSGKSTLGAAAIGLQALDGGEVLFDGTPMPAEGSPAWRTLRRRVQVIFQDPFSALNPRQTIGQSLAEPLRLHSMGPRRSWPDRIAELLELVGLNPEMARQYPGTLSGGQRQRVCIARALAVEPDLIVCDEITSALDVSTQAQIVALIADIQKRMGVALLFISHDLGLVRAIADRTAVMYLGRIMEAGPAGEVFETPRHPYTRALLGAAPIPDPVLEARRERIPLRGEIPDPADPPSGCRFRTRCPHAREECAKRTPLPEPAGGAIVACHFWREITGTEDRS
ncbi:ABC transporter ATP-binding protein [Pelagibacterium montanilacus]|uniref:ABC transporter ATP-binding protein n=1 Tax=Pelagibacterium montanilacus TaxID=2185280 RepID=UPI000F8F527A|nr:ABC transporter ATP-binding protein [Pelagibacterium montanilacus]